VAIIMLHPSATRSQHLDADTHNV